MMVAKNDYTVFTSDFWNEEETEKTSYTVITFGFDRWNVAFNNDTKQPESIGKIPAILQLSVKEYKANTKNAEAQEALKAASEIYYKLNQLQAV